MTEITIKRAKPLLGTIVEITAYGDKANSAVTAAFRAVQKIHSLMSFFETNSNISQINHSVPGDEVVVDSHTYYVLTIAQQLGIDSNGAFDITAAGSRLVSMERLTYDAGTFRDIVLLSQNKVLRRKKVYIDLGGIAKGYAVDMAIQALQAYGATSGIVNAGGDIRIFGKSQPVHIRYADCPNKLAFIGNMTDCAIATSSGVYGNEPLISPSTGKNVKWKNGITVISKKCVIADALTKIVRLAHSIAPVILEKYSAKAIIIDKNSVHNFREEAEVA